jgi:hypothetical protein
MVDADGTSRRIEMAGSAPKDRKTLVIDVGNAGHGIKDLPGVFPWTTRPATSSTDGMMPTMAGTAKRD